MNLVHRRRGREARCRGAASRSGAAVTAALIPLPPSRALRWLREAWGSGGLPPGPAEPRRPEAAARSDTAFGPAAAARHRPWLTQRASQVLLDGARAKQPRVGEDPDQREREQHRRQGGPAGVVQVDQERVLDDGPDHGVARAAEDLLVDVVAERGDERQQERRKQAGDGERENDAQERFPLAR